MSTYTVCSDPVNLLGSAPPKLSSPLVIESEVVGSKETPTCLAPMRPAVNALSVTVGTGLPSEVVPRVPLLLEVIFNILA